MADRTVIIIRETVAESIVTDVVTFACLIVSIAVGKWLGSDALQWIAGILMVLTIIATKPRWRKTFYSIADAKAYLDTIK